tara:strand:+ start:76 stop:525 length:450 start_codon:yes stop_codon:yes gene_type:complete
LKRLLLLSALLIFTCSSDDSASDDNNQSFLEKYNGVVWKDDGFDDGFGDYIYFYYSFTLNSISQAEKYGADCEPGSTNWDVEDSEGLYLRVVENLPEKLVFEELELPDNGIPELVTYTVTTINNGNGVEIRYSFDNSIDTYTRVSDFCE